MKQSDRLLGIDITRAVAIILVVIGHWNPENAPCEWNTFVKWIYTFHMPLFLVISGYLFARTSRPYGNLLKGKFYRLLVPYFIASIIVITIKLLTPGNLSVDHPVTPSAYLEMFWRPSAGTFLWFIWALWICFCIVPVFKGRRNHLILFVLTVIMAYLPGQFPQIFALNYLKGNMMWFVAGVVIYDYKDYIKFNSLKVGIISVLGMIILSICFISGCGICYYIIPYFACIAAISLSTISVSHIRQSVLKIILSISSASYIIYLFHTTFEGITKSLINQISPDIQFWLMSVIVITAGVVMPWAMNYGLGFCPRFIKILFGLAKPKSIDR